MKRKVLICLPLLISCLLMPAIVNAENGSSSDSVQWQQAYYDYLVENISDQNTTYGLFYIDDDSIPELAIGFNGSGRFDQVHLFTYYNDSVCDLGLVGSFTSFSYLENENLIKNSIPQGGFMGYIKVQSIENGKLKTIYEFELNHADETYNMGEPGALAPCSYGELESKLSSYFPASEVKSTPDVMFEDVIFRCNENDLKLILSDPGKVTY